MKIAQSFSLPESRHGFDMEWCRQLLIQTPKEYGVEDVSDACLARLKRCTITVEECREVQVSFEFFVPWERYLPGGDY